MSSCEHIQHLMMRRLDGLASSDEVNELETHLAGCGNCSAEWADFRVTKDATDRMRNGIIFDDVLDEIEAGLVARLSRNVASGLLMAGALVLLVFGVIETLLSDQIPLAVRSGAALLGAGFLLFCWETIKWKMRTYARDPYRDVVR